MPSVRPAATKGLRRLVPVLQRAMVVTDRGPGRWLWRLVYLAAARVYAAYVLRHEAGAAAYLRGTASGEEALHGLSDIDLAFVLAAESDARAKLERVRGRCERASRAVPVLGELVFDWPSVYAQADLEDAAGETTLTYRLERERGHSGRAVYFGPGADPHKARLLERPEMYGPRSTWRWLRGPDRRPAEPEEDAGRRRVAAWLELQNWWRWAFDACINPDLAHNASLCVKLIAEPVRVWLWLVRGERVPMRIDALERGLAEIPEEAEAFERARELQRALRGMPRAPLAELLPSFVRLSSRIADELTDQVEVTGWTQVELTGSGEGELALPYGGWHTARPDWWSGPPPPLLPLVDWRTLAFPKNPDESFALVPGDPGDPPTLAGAATGIDRGPYPTLSAGGLLVRPVAMGGRGRLRAVACAATDPVSFAMRDGSPTARFPNVRGWSVRDTARRAVAEHAAWLDDGDPEPSDEAGTPLGRLITAARAALLWETVESGSPELPLTMEATLNALVEHPAGQRSVVDAARESYRDFADVWRQPADGVTAALHEVVAALPAYAARRRVRAAA